VSPGPEKGCDYTGGLPCRKAIKLRDDVGQQHAFDVDDLVLEHQLALFHRCKRIVKAIAVLVISLMSCTDLASAFIVSFVLYVY
jgi:hypothetical protein